MNSLSKYEIICLNKSQTNKPTHGYWCCKTGIVLLTVIMTDNDRGFGTINYSCSSQPILGFLVKEVAIRYPMTFGARVSV